MNAPLSLEDFAHGDDGEGAGELAALQEVYPAPRDPAELGYPPTLPIELALREQTPQEIREAYGYTREAWGNLLEDPGFMRDLAAAVEMVRVEGMSFKIKARLQAEALLKTSWKLIHAPSDEVSPAVKADLIKSTARWAGYEPKNTPGGGNDGVMPLQINIQFNQDNRSVTLGGEGE